MCFGKSKSSAPPPAPQVTMPNPANVADTSNDPQKMAAINAAEPSPMSSFGSELGGGNATMPAGVTG